MKIDDLKKSIEVIVKKLVDQKYEEIYAEDYRKLLTPDLIKQAIEEYPGELSLVTDCAFKEMRYYLLQGGEYTIDFPLWYDNKRSDLILVSRFKMVDGEIKYAIEDILIQ